MTADSVERLRRRIIESAEATRSLVPGNAVEPSLLSPSEIATLWAEHRTRLLEAFSEVTLRSKPHRIAVVGSGRCDSFPLETFLRRCRDAGVGCVDLLDIDLAAARTAVCSLPSPLRDCVDAKPIDITGMLNAILDRVLNPELKRSSDRLIARGADLPDALSEVISTVLEDRIAERKPGFAPGGYDLTISDCVATQINNTVGVSTLGQWGPYVEKHGAAVLAPMIETHEGILLRDHVEVLRRMTSPGGTVLLCSDVVQFSPARERFLNRGIDLRKILLGVCPDLQINHAFDPWHWQRTVNNSEDVMAVTISA